MSTWLEDFGLAALAFLMLGAILICVAWLLIGAWTVCYRLGRWVFAGWGSARVRREVGR